MAKNKQQNSIAWKPPYHELSRLNTSNIEVYVYIKFLGPTSRVYLTLTYVLRWVIIYKLNIIRVWPDKRTKTFFINSRENFTYCTADQNRYECMRVKTQELQQNSYKVTYILVWHKL